MLPFFHTIFLGVHHVHVHLAMLNICFSSVHFGLQFAIWADDQVTYGEIRTFFFGWRCPKECKASFYGSFCGKDRWAHAHIVWAFWKREQVHRVIGQCSCQKQNSRVDQVLNFISFLICSFTLFSPTPNLSMASAICRVDEDKAHCMTCHACICLSQDVNMSMCLTLQNWNHMAKHFSANGGPPTHAPWMCASNIDLTKHRLYT